MLRFVSWNVNGLRACLAKGFMDYFNNQQADFFCIQETKMQPGQADIQMPGYFQFWNSADKKGYSGTAIFTRHEPMQVHNGIDIDLHDHEGRVITLEYPGFYLVTCYTPNSQRGLTRLEYRAQWEDDFLAYISSLTRRKPLVFCGDLNVAHQEIDLRNPATNHQNAGFTDLEREKMTRLLESGYVDTFRHLYPDAKERYSWWSYINHAREKNVGWRIDYFIVSASLSEKIREAQIHEEVLGSDHCPVSLSLDMPSALG